MFLASAQIKLHHDVIIVAINFNLAAFEILE
jgi:hypothetical protein